MSGSVFNAGNGNINISGAVGDNNTVIRRQSPPAAAAPRPAAPAPEREPEVPTAPYYRVHARPIFRRYLHTSWRDLADAVGIPAHERPDGSPGEIADFIWGWIEAREQLPALSSHLVRIQREDLARRLDEHRTGRP
jgi:hypothetical protein